MERVARWVPLCNIEKDGVKICARCDALYPEDETACPVCGSSETLDKKEWVAREYKTWCTDVPLSEATHLEYAVWVRHGE